jgi:glycosyltransferase involved in cell wall biosynthesis
MRFLLINPNAAHDYDVDTPFERPLAGAESAQVHLALALTALGHEVDLVTGTHRPGIRRGVFCHSLARSLPSPQTADAILVTNAPRYALELRPHIGSHPRLFAWEHNIWDPQPLYGDCLKALALAGSDILCVSQWHLAHFIEHGGISADRLHLLPNALGPAFLSLFAEGEDVLAAKAHPPRLIFAATPYKGLDAALACFQVLRQQMPEVTLDIYSSFELYPQNNPLRRDARWRLIADAARNIDGITMHDLVPNATLGDAMKGAAMLFYPNTLPETSSIVTLEALAAGCLVYAPPFAALPETAGPWLYPMPLNARHRFTPAGVAEGALGLLKRWMAGEPELTGKLQQQVRQTTANCRWTARAQELVALVAGKSTVMSR